MTSYKISVIYPTDPLCPGIGGTPTFIKSFIKYAPEDFDVKFIGISSNDIERPPKKWIRLSLGNKKFDFFPLFFEKDESKKTLIPLSLRFTFALKLSHLEFDKRLLFFNRIEPAIIFRKKEVPKIGIIASDVLKQLEKAKSEVLWSKFPWLYFKFENLVFDSLDIVYTMNKNTLEFYHSRYQEHKEKFHFLPTWVDTEVFYPLNGPKEEIRQKLIAKDNQLSPLGKWVIFVGRLQRVKAPWRLIRSFYEYHKTDKNSQLLIIGEGNLKQKVKNFVKEIGLGGSVHFLGFISQEELAEYYRAADVMLLTSNFEGMPRCVLEALASGLPVVSTDVGEVKRIIHNGISGEIVSSFSPLDISKSLKKVMDNHNSYSKDNCLNAISEFTSQKVLKTVYEKIRELLQNTNS